jgi:hypothetical protein
LNPVATVVTVPDSRVDTHDRTFACGEVSRDGKKSLIVSEDELSYFGKPRDCDSLGQSAAIVKDENGSICGGKAERANVEVSVVDYETFSAKTGGEGYKPVEYSGALLSRGCERNYG